MSVAPDTPTAINSRRRRLRSAEPMRAYATVRIFYCAQRLNKENMVARTRLITIEVISGK